jgi:hypothetical protein
MKPKLNDGDISLIIEVINNHIDGFAEEDLEEDADLKADVDQLKLLRDKLRKL